ncbi:MAG: phosphogluconate dehydrogenase (NAD(+)-dependent, decarboxylating) [Armatimonadota bacterium]
MDIGFIGLGRMGLNMVARLVQGGHRVLGYSPSGKHRAAVEEAGGMYADTIQELVKALPSPRVIWLMVPAGAIVDQNIALLVPMLAPGDIIVDGGNSNYHDSQRRAAQLSEQGIGFIDAGTSGGVWGLTLGYCMMVGGEPEVVAKVEPAFITLAPPEGYLHVGPAGAGHFVKMVHNGIEYGLLQAYAEGFEIMHANAYDLNLEQIANLWNHGSVVRSWLLELAEAVFKQDSTLDDISGYVEDSGEGRWTVQEAIDSSVPAPVLTLSLLMRLRSRQPDSYSAKVIAALRNQFGGHALKMLE